MLDTKHPLKSIGIMGPAIGLVVFAINQWKPGLGITVPEVSGIIDQIDVVLSSLLAIYGRWTATKAISISAPITTPPR